MRNLLRKSFIFSGAAVATAMLLPIVAAPAEAIACGLTEAATSSVPPTLPLPLRGSQPVPKQTRAAINIRKKSYSRAMSAQDNSPLKHTRQCAILVLLLTILGVATRLLWRSQHRAHPSGEGEDCDFT
ncbi:hypothetical protein V6C03_14305 [Methyloligella sp. 2.7D]|uniref:hypothetical protein n=1 Tax=unclassified Methyloligella TaxID=2625955 RepID=UPI00157DF643|nr:hypothetical protein [Methyloligella sp. GL2]QKP77073.1 hypothetical protein HT051_06160 [Methyloligella sp. GL2]